MNTRYDKKERRIILFFIVLCVVVYLVSWIVPLIEIDAAQYANISREMMLSKSYLQVYDRGQDYLDKPPLLMWLGALSMKIFGVSAAAYRLPSFLFALLAIFSTYKFTSLFYQERIALLSALVLASCQAMFLINHDVRTDTMLMGWVIFSLWQLAEWYQYGSWRNLVLAAIGIGGGMLTKGPIALMVPVFAFGPHFVLQRSFRQLFRWQYLIILLIIAILLIPMSIGLYEQFDLHPEKLLYGRTGTSGLRFFYWTQSFGRITGESTWSENSHFYFLFENLLWGMLPWTIPFVLGLFTELRDIIRRRFRIGGQDEWITTGGFVVTYCALGVSHYQLPHYIYVVLPLACIITGKWLFTLLYTDQLTAWRKPLFIIHAVIFALLGIALFLLLYIPFPPPNYFLIALLLLSVAVVILLLAQSRIRTAPLLSLCVMSVLVINFFLDTGFYPRLLEYQSGVKASQLIRAQKLNKDRFFIYRINEDRTLHFYSNHFFPHVNDPDSLNSRDYLLTSATWIDSLNRSQFIIVDSFPDFHVSTLSLPFLNPARRKQETTEFYILQKR